MVSLSHAWIEESDFSCFYLTAREQQSFGVRMCKGDVILFYSYCNTYSKVLNQNKHYCHRVGRSKFSVKFSSVKQFNLDIYHLFRCHLDGEQFQSAH